jgi:hypothetical protein
MGPNFASVVATRQSGRLVRVERGAGGRSRRQACRIPTEALSTADGMGTALRPGDKSVVGVVERLSPQREIRIRA